MKLNEKVLDYRSNHKRCEFCKYSRYRLLYTGYQSHNFWECELKEHNIKFGKLKALFCKYYELEGEYKEK